MNKKTVAGLICTVISFFYASSALFIYFLGGTDPNRFFLVGVCMIISAFFGALIFMVME